MSDLNSLQGISDISLLDQSKTVSYNVCKKFKPYVICCTDQYTQTNCGNKSTALTKQYQNK